MVWFNDIFVGLQNNLATIKYTMCLPSGFSTCLSVLPSPLGVVPFSVVDIVVVVGGSVVGSTTRDRQTRAPFTYLYNFLVNKLNLTPQFSLIE